MILIDVFWDNSFQIEASPNSVCWDLQYRGGFSLLLLVPEALKVDLIIAGKRSMFD
jgi:hypothetical protein